MLREYRRDGSDKCGISARMDIIMAETLREWLANLALKNFGVHTVFRQTILFASFVVTINIRGILSARSP